MGYKYYGIGRNFWSIKYKIKNYIFIIINWLKYIVYISKC